VVPSWTAVAGAFCSSTVIPQTGSIAILEDYRAEEGRVKGALEAGTVQNLKVTLTVST
jgi:hypothetical protein